jgi:hypothetical protein
MQRKKYYPNPPLNIQQLIESQDHGAFMMQPKPIELNQHPLFNCMELRISTSQIEDLHEALTHWLWLGFPGGIVLGQARVGKTTALNMQFGTFKNRQKQIIPCKFATIPKRDRPTIKAVFNCLASALKIKTSIRMTTDVVSDLIKNKLADLSCANDTKTVLLAVDEVQRLSVEQFEAFAELHDDLSIAKINLCIVLIANAAAFSTQIEKIKTEKFEHIRGRFFNHCHFFYGFRNINEVEFALNQLDTIATPGKNNISYTEYFLPDDYKNKFRMSSLSKSIWGVFHENFQLKHNLESWPAKYFFEFVSVFLGDFLYKHGVNEISDEMILNSINATGLLPNSVFNTTKI